MAEQEVQVKPKRRRRTKAEIEADKARKEQAKEVKTNTSDVEENATEEVCASTEEVVPVDTSVEVREEGEKGKSDNTVSSDSVSKPDVEANSLPDKAFVGSMTVYEAPFDGAYAKKLFGAFTPLCKVNGFVQVEYVKHGFGLVRGYVKPDSFIK